MATDAIEVDVWSDLACPWCYIGKRRLEAGIAAFAETPDAPPVVVEYHSFELAPDTPVDFDGSEIDFLVRHKHLPAADVRQMLERVQGIAESVGLDYDFDAMQHTNTVKAHELLHYAKAHGRQLAMKERLLHAYFIEGRHIGRDEDLADLAADVGLERADVLRSLEGGEYLARRRAPTKPPRSRTAFVAYRSSWSTIATPCLARAAPETFTDVLRDVAAAARWTRRRDDDNDHSDVHRQTRQETIMRLVPTGARLVLGSYLAVHGTQKLFGVFDGAGLDATGKGFESIGLKPGREMAILAGASELVGGVLTATGVAEPLGPITIAGAMAVAAAVHRKAGPLGAKGGYELPLTNLALAAVLAAGAHEGFRLSPRLPRGIAVLLGVGAGALAGFSVAQLVRHSTAQPDAASVVEAEPETDAVTE